MIGVWSRERPCRLLDFSCIFSGEYNDNTNRITSSRQACRCNTRQNGEA
ncbi:hypothetical protein BRUCa_2498 [Brucella melitensis]|nr:hypothetical protein BM28_B0329 [Brucella melitensis M28]ADZ88444.1 hypothetical protein BM590_B0327 [Brucella melitensis M5-90]AEW15623.1 hypothetical protein BCA52141_II0715 [Brucella canis HSK A52141]AEW19543.1 hypothetical protein BAA13334_II01569 [Brucella abortus A13334]AIB18996.1 Hypothetical protein BSSP3_II0303 [Brucella suis bv. 2]